jgi:hypothetical protein
MNLTTRLPWLLSIAATVAVTVVLPGCDQVQQPTPRATQDGAARPSPAETPPATPQASVNEGAKSTGGVDANVQTAEPMTKDEESTTMPQPGQANDHSTTARDRNS